VSKRRLKLLAPIPRFVDEAGQIIKVDAADDADLISDVATENGSFILSVAPAVAPANPGFKQRRASELFRFLEEEIDLSAIRPIGVDECFAVWSS
jgi:hypothetical protein